MIADAGPPVRQRQMSARLRLTLSYAGFLLLAGIGTLVGIYAVLRWVPNYPIVDGSPRDIAAAIASQRTILEAVLRASIVIVGVLLAIGLGGGWLLAGWILRPLRDINDAARIAATGRLDHRIRLAGRADEFGQLADSFDHMLDRLHSAFMAQERFAANASHELRTPLTVTATMLEVAVSDPEQRYDPQLLHRLQVTNTRAIELTEALLRLADANAVTARAEHLDLAAIVDDAVDERRALAASRGLKLHREPGPAPMTGDPALTAQLVGNLLQNAYIHSDREGEVWITTRAKATTSSALLEISNTGPTYTAETASRLKEPFLRGAGRTAHAGDEKGHGLGLALVAQIAEVHNAELTLAPRPGGGLTVTVEFPVDGVERSFV